MQKSYKTIFKKFMAAALTAAVVSAFLPTAFAADDGEKFVVLSAPSTLAERLWTESRGSGNILARYADDKTPISMSAYYDGRIFATVPAENADRSIEAFIMDEVKFTDMPEDYSYEFYVMKAAAECGLINGDDDGSARPYDTITRAEAATIITRMLGVTADYHGGFNDIAEGDWFADNLAAAKEYKIAEGEPDGGFHPDRTVTREEFTVMAYRAAVTAGLCYETEGATAADVDKNFLAADTDKISDWALNAYAKFGNLNILDYEYDAENPDDEGRFVYAPQNEALRFEAAGLLRDVLESFQCYPSEAAIKYGFDKEMPVIDGSTSTYPFTEAVYNELFLNGYDHKDKPASHSKSHASYERLINGEVDMLFASVYPASDILALAEEKGVELELIPIAYDAMVFFTNADNPSEGLTSEQITNIYVNNAYENWNEVGGADALLYPYCRNNDSGSHAQMERHFLNGNEINEKIRTENTSDTMANILTNVMDAQTDDPVGYGLGYSIYYYFNNMDMFYETHKNLKLLSIDGVFPTDETIADGSYPLSNNTYVVMLKSQPENSPARKMAEFMLTEEGQECVRTAGFGPLKTEK